MMLRRLFIFAAVAGSLFLAGAPSARADDQAAKEFVDGLAKQAIEVMTGKGIADKDRVDRFRSLFTASVDMPEIGKFVLGRYWRTSQPEEQQKFLKLFEDILVLTWSNRFKEASGNIQFKVNNTQPDGDTGVLVDSQILREKQEPVSVIWRLRKPEGKLKVIDLVIEGTSMSNTYRSEYASVANANGGVSGLLSAMEKKITQLQQPVATKTN